MEEEPPIYRIPHDTLHQIFSSLPLRQIILCRSLSKFFLHLLSTPSFLHHLSASHPPLHLLALRHRHVPHTPPAPPSLPLFDPNLNTWLHFPLDFLPFHSPLPVASSHGLLYLWAQPHTQAQAQPHTQPQLQSTKSLISCNPLTRTFRVLPRLGSAWSRHGHVLVDADHRVMVLTELAALYCHRSSHWLKFSSNLPSKPRSPLLINDNAFALCDVGSPWRSHWKLYSCRLAPAATAAINPSWTRVERQEWGDVFDVLKRPRLVRGVGNRILMVGGLKSSFALNAPCSTILVLRLDLDRLEWDEAARMPPEMFKCFRESSKFKVFGGGDRVCFSAKRIGKLALWDRLAAANGDEWRWIDNLPGNGDGLYRGFVFEGRLNVLP